MVASTDEYKQGIYLSGSKFSHFKWLFSDLPIYLGILQFHFFL